jgi:hypothetical protein
MEDDASQTDFTKWLLFAAFFLLVGFGIGVNEYDDYYWQQGSAETCGVIADFVGENADNNTSIYYKFTVKQTVYEGGITGSDLFRGCDKTKACLGKPFRVMYAIKNPNVNKIFFDALCQSQAN